jgi:hypothetical protein
MPGRGHPVTLPDNIVHIRVGFDAPPTTIIELQEVALNAYQQWKEDPSDDNEEYLADCIYEQCESHIAAWSTLDFWDEVE